MKLSIKNSNFTNVRKAVILEAPPPDLDFSADTVNHIGGESFLIVGPVAQIMVALELLSSEKRAALEPLKPLEPPIDVSSRRGWFDAISEALTAMGEVATKTAMESICQKFLSGT